MEAGAIFIAVGAVIEDEKGRVLLVKHVPERGGFWQGKWICPGGGLKYGETIEQGITREVMEETGLEISLTAPLVPFERVVEDKGETVLHVVYIDWLAKVACGELKVGSDVGEAVWAPREDIPQLWEELHDDTKRLLEIAKLV